MRGVPWARASMRIGQELLLGVCRWDTNSHVIVSVQFEPSRVFE
jgi:hypothetical protein